MKLTIDRDVWLRGEGPDESYMHREEDGKMCCLGIYLEACGIPKEAMTQLKTPAEPLRKHNPDPGKDVSWAIMMNNGRLTNSPITNQLMRINDSIGIDEANREDSVREILGERGIEVEFVN